MHVDTIDIVQTHKETEKKRRKKKGKEIET